MTSTLPQLDGGVFITEGGLETDLIFLHGIDLPDFASFPLLDTDEGRRVLSDYYDAFVPLARRDGTGAVFETPTWRASSDWGVRLGYSAEDLDRVNRAAVRLVRDVADRHPDVPVVVSGNLGPRGDGYVAGEAMTAEEAQAYHAPQVASLVGAGADMLGALTMTYVAEAVGIARAADAAGCPVALAFTVETDGRLPDGTPLADAVREVDDVTGASPAYYVLNCAHPTHLVPGLTEGGPWERVRGVRVNASALSHAELDEAQELDAGDPARLAVEVRDLREVLPRLSVVGGCCGTDVRHVDAMSAAFAAG